MKRVEIYTTRTCPYCLAAKELLTAKGAAFEETDVGADPALRAAMRDRANGRHTEPQIFFGGVHVGGCDDLHALDRAGKLHAMLGL